MAFDKAVIDPIDVHVGARMRQRRKLGRMSQTALAKRIGVSFQQVQKYELGKNRISASKLYQAAEALSVLITYFFDGYGKAPEERFGDVLTAEGGTAPKGVEDIEVFERFLCRSNVKVRSRVMDLVRALAEE